MKKIVTVLLSFCFITSALAGVRLITSDESSNPNRGVLPNLTVMNNASRCRDEGFSTTSCSSGKVLRLPCPYSDSYYKGCCDPKYNYTMDYCYEQDMTPSTDSCQGFYYCIDKVQH